MSRPSLAHRSPSWRAATVALIALIGTSGCVTSALDLDSIGEEPEPAAEPEPTPQPAPEPDPQPVDEGVDQAVDMWVRDLGPVDLGPDMPADMAPPDQGVDMADMHVADEGVDGPAPCAVGETRPCGNTEEGACAFGVATCGDDGTFGLCAGAIGPSDETCNGVDDDCDGIVDEAVPPTPCGSDIGACAFGEQACVDGALGPCVGATEPTVETCDGADNDCDGEADEEVLQACDPAEGVCAVGTQSCEAGVFGACEQPADAVNERCNGGDDDCDGFIDEGLERPCGQGCPVGVQRCEGGLWTLCDVPAPSDEICDGVDNDCDDVIDEGLRRACGVDVAPCVLGEETCVAGAWVDCDAAVLPQEETCNAVDDDCNGVVDDNVPSIPCGVEEGVCQPGQRHCEAGVFGLCDGNVDPDATDPCNGLDDDCDGNTDEDGAVPCGGDVGECRPGVFTCVDGVLGDVCEGGLEPAPEGCNDLDDDCDGTVDEGEGGRPLVCPLPGAFGQCVVGVCEFDDCRPGFLDVDFEPANGCERGCAAAGAQIDYNPVAREPSVRLAMQGRAEAMVYRVPAGEQTHAVLVTEAGARTVGPRTNDVALLDVVPTVAAGWIVATIATTDAGLRRIDWYLRDFDGDAFFDAGLESGEATQIALAQHAPSSRFVVASVAGADDASGTVDIVVQDQAEPGALPIAPVNLADGGARVAVRPVATSTADGFLVAYAAVEPLGVQVVYLDTNGRAVRRFTVETPGVPTALALGRAGRDARLAARVGGRTIIQPLSLDAPPDLLPRPADNSGLNAQSLDVVTTENGFMITFINAVGDVRGRLLEANGSYAAPTFDFLGEAEPARAVDTLTATSEGRRVLLTWSIGDLAQRIALGCD